VTTTVNLRSEYVSLDHTYGSASQVSEWLHTYSLLTPDLRLTVQGLIKNNSGFLAQAFYQTLLQHPEAGLRLSHDLVSQRLLPSLQRWMLSLVSAETPEDVESLLVFQRKVGEIHARIGIPVHLVTLGTRILKSELAILIRALELDGNTCSFVHQYLDNLFDLAMEQMGLAFTQGADRSTRSEEAYRLFALGQNISAERERQRASLFDWSQQVLFSLHRGINNATLQSLAGSEFGLWISHKAETMFTGSPELVEIKSTILVIDNVLLPQLSADVSTLPQHPIVEFQTAIGTLAYLLNSLFDKAAEIESGRDTVTQLLSRKFVATVLKREIAHATQSHEPFCILIVDVDHFKLINDEYGHSSGDIALRQIAQTLQARSRSSDFVFRYGGEEFLILLVNVDAEQALVVAEQLRQQIAENSVHLRDETRIKVTASFGVAQFDGHPDYEHLIERADKALYLAKNQGRNRCVLAR